MENFMGCYIINGFASNLPIFEDDDIVAIVCANTRKYDAVDPHPCMIDSYMTPLFAPFFGKYDDFGGIKDIKEDYNYSVFKKRFGMTLEEFNGINKCRSISEIAEMKEVSKLSSDITSYEYDLLEKEEKILHVIVDSISKRHPGHAIEYDKMHDDNIRFFVIYERLDVYEKFIKFVQKPEFYENYNYYNSDVITESYDSTFDYMKKIFNTNTFSFNVYTTDLIQYAIDHIIELNKTKNEDEQIDISKYTRLTVPDKDGNLQNVFQFRVIGTFELFNDSETYSGYNDVELNVDELRSNMIDFTMFNKALEYANIMYNFSTYSGQTINKMKCKLNKLIYCMSENILKNKLK